TGVTWFTVVPKQMELLKEIVPNLRRVAYVVGVAGDTNAPPEYFKISEETRQIAAARLDLHGRFFQLPSRTITTKSLPALRQIIFMPLISQGPVQQQQRYCVLTSQATFPSSRQPNFIWRSI